jgi:hypothetical protein
MKADNPYAQIDKAMLEASNLSFKAKGILSYLLSRPDGWETNIPDLINHSTDKETAIRTGIRELREAGYLKQNQVREGGKIIKWVYEVYENPAFIDYFETYPHMKNVYSESG